MASARAQGRAALEMRGLRVTLGGRLIVRDVSLAAEHGTVTAVLGPNGAGKSTLLRALVGLVPCAGEIALEGQDLSRMERRERARRLAYVPQRSALDAPLCVETVVGHGRYAHTGSAALGKEDARAVREAMAATDVATLARRSYLELSGGEQRRVLIARALATGARILLLDEPSASLDIGHALALFALLRRLADTGVCVVVVLHDLDDALTYADRAALLHQGRVVAHGATAEVVAAEPVRQVYGVDMGTAARLCFSLPRQRRDEG